MNLPSWLPDVIWLAVWVALVVILVPLLMKILRKLTKRTRTQLDDIIIQSLGRPVIIILIAAGLRIFAVAEKLPDRIAQIIQAVTLVLFILGIFLFVDSLLTTGIALYRKRIEFIKTSGNIIKTIFRVVILGIALLIILDSLGISISPLLASLGIGGLAVALALQGTRANFFSGIYIMIDKPVKVGDFIQLSSGEEGYVEKIGWRSTHIRMIPNNIVVIPNSKLADNQLINYHLPHPEMSVLVQVGVSYDSDLEHVEKVTRDVAKEIIKELEGGVTEFEPFIRYHTFNDFSIDFTVILRVHEYVDKYLVTHEFVKRLHKRYNKEGIVIPFPITTVEMKKS